MAEQSETVAGAEAEVDIAEGLDNQLPAIGAILDAPADAVQQMRANRARPSRIDRKLHAYVDEING
jgi:hypothetical protein